MTRTLHHIRHRARCAPIRSPHRRNPRLRRRISRRTTTASQQNAAKELAKNLSEAYSRVRTVQNGDVVTLIDPNHSPDVGTSTRSRRRMAPVSQYQANTRRPSPASDAKVDTLFAGRSAQRQPSKQTYYAKPRAPHNSTATVPAAPPSSHTAVFHRTYPPHSQTIQKPTSCT